MHHYDLYGLVVASDVAFANPVPPLPGDRTPDLTVVRRDTSPPDHDWSTGEVVDVQGEQEGRPADFVFVRFPDHDAVRLGSVMDFHVHDDTIVCVLHDAQQEFLVEIALLGMVMALWFERRGTTTLHASVVSVHGAAVGFLGSKGAGKTSTMAGCLAAGHRLLVDDLVVLRRATGGFEVPRGFPALRMWPEQARQVAPGALDLPLVRPDAAKVRADVRELFGGDAFAPGEAPLGALYLPVREAAGSAVSFSPLRADEAVMALVRNSFLPAEVHRFGWQPRRLTDLADLVRDVPVVRFTYPSGYDVLPDVVAALVGDVSSRSDLTRSSGAGSRSAR